MFTISGKIFVVVAVLALVFIGIIAFMIHTDNKLRRLEKELNKK